MAFEQCNKDETQIIPIILGDCLIPDSLKSFIYVDFGNHYASGLKELLQLMGITSRMFSETQMINSILKMLPDRHKKYISKYVFSNGKPVDIARRLIAELLFFLGSGFNKQAGSGQFIKYLVQKPNGHIQSL